MNNKNNIPFQMVKTALIGDTGNIRNFEDVSDLAASIQAHGIINPITVAKDGEKFKAVAGFRRLAAAKKIGMEEVPCHVVDGDGKTLTEISLSENVTRQDMTEYEECLAVKKLIDKKNTPQAVAKKFGKNLRWVLVRKMLADCGDKVMEKVKNGSIDMKQAARISDLDFKDFKKEMEDCYRLNKWDADCILERHHKSLKKAPFDTTVCKDCPKCSTAQKDLFTEDEEAQCLDHTCWAKQIRKKAEAVVKELTAKGENARLGKVEGKRLCYDDEAYKYEIPSWNTKQLDEAKAKCIKQRCVVNPENARILRYYDKRDIPGFKEETEEEAEERRAKAKKDSLFESTKKRMHLENMQAAIVKSCSNFDSKADKIATLMLFAAENNYDFMSEEGKKIIHIDDEKDDGDEKYIEDMPDEMTATDVGKAIRKSIKEIVSTMFFDTDNSVKAFRVITGKNPDDVEPSKKEVNAEIERQEKEEEKKRKEREKKEAEAEEENGDDDNPDNEE